MSGTIKGPFRLNIFGQQPSLNIYTQISLCYSWQKESENGYASIIKTLQGGMDRLLASFPWLGGEVGIEPVESGVYVIKLPKTPPRLVVKDYRVQSLGFNMQDLRNARFPCRLLPEDLVAPRKTFPGCGEIGLPVFMVQATFIVGGVLLTFVGHHQAMDMTGLGLAVRKFSKACIGAPFSADELDAGAPPCCNILPAIGDDPQAYSKYVVSSVGASESSNDTASVPLVWSNFTFSKLSLSKLKQLAMETATALFVSTDDALSSFLWQCIARSRLIRLAPTTKSTMARAVDPRRYLGFPETYPGLMQSMVYQQEEMGSLVQKPLGSIASMLRNRVDIEASTVCAEVYAFVSALRHSSTKAVSVMAKLNMSTDIALSSWKKEDLWSHDFGMGLVPEAVRRPRFDPVESLIYLLPLAPNGEVSAMICLREDDLSRLRSDPIFAKYAEYVG